MAFSGKKQPAISGRVISDAVKPMASVIDKPIRNGKTGTFWIRSGTGQL